MLQRALAAPLPESTRIVLRGPFGAPQDEGWAYETGAKVAAQPYGGSVPPGPSERWTITVSVQWPNL